MKAFPLSMILKACPQISDYGQGVRFPIWRELMRAAVVVQGRQVAGKPKPPQSRPLGQDRSRCQPRAGSGESSGTVEEPADAKLVIDIRRLAVIRLPLF